MAISIGKPAEGATNSAKGAGAASTTPISNLKITLPTSKSVPSTELSDYVIFLYGQRKIGKTTLATCFPAALHLFFEPGGKGVETYAMEITSWDALKQIAELMYTPAADLYKNIVLDTADIMYDQCMQYMMMMELGGLHPGEISDYGASWKKVRAEFTKVVSRLAKCGKGLIVISHAKETEIKTRFHGDWTKIIPTLPGQAIEFLTGFADINAYYGYFGTDRWLIMDGSESIEVGGRKMGNKAFRTPSGEKVVAIPMFDDANPNFDEKDAYENILRAFRGEQENAFSEVHEDPARLTELRAAMKKVAPKRN